jgi:hypothetical protein
MSWIAFGLGVLVGTVTGVLVVSLCQMASSVRPRQVMDRQSGIRYEPLRSAMLAKHADLGEL